MKAASSGVARCALWCLVVGVALILILALSPIRWDAKSFRSNWVETEPPLEHGSRVLFVSADNDWQAGHVAGYGLELATFPDADALWIVPAENYRAGSWTPDLLLTAAGDFVEPRDGRIGAVPSVDPGTSVVLSSPDLVPLLRSRWPAAAQAVPHLLVPPRAPLIGRIGAPSAVQALHLLLLVASLGGVLALAWRGTRDRRLALRVVAMAVGVPVWMAVHVLLMYILGKLHVSPAAGAFAIEAILFWGIAYRLSGNGAVESPIVRTSARESRENRAVPWVIGVLLLMQIATSIARRDFDGDMLTHWLPAARSYYYVGDHDIEFLTRRFGLHHEATYPPAFPILLASMLWVADADPRQSLAAGGATDIFVFLYRLMLAVLATAVLAGAGALVLSVKPNAWPLAIGFPLLIALVVPLLSGRPNAGEVFFVPMVASALLAWLAACVLRWPAMGCCAVLLALFTLMIKNDASVVWPLVLLPWLLMLPRGSGLRARDVAVPTVVALLPWLHWKMQMLALGSGAHFAFEPFTWSGLLARGQIIGSLYARASQLLLGIPGWAPVLLLLPACVAWLVVTRRWHELPIPLAAGAYVAVLPLICSFSRGERLVDLEVSFERIASSGFVALLFFCLSLILRAGTERSVDETGRANSEASAVEVSAV